MIARRSHRSNLRDWLDFVLARGIYRITETYR